MEVRGPAVVKIVVLSRFAGLRITHGIQIWHHLGQLVKR